MTTNQDPDHALGTTEADVSLADATAEEVSRAEASADEATAAEGDVVPDDDSDPDDEGDVLPERRLRSALPEATPAARRKLVEALSALEFTDAAAEAVARAVEDPRALVEQLKAPAELGVHGGTIRYVLTRVRNATVLPIPTNPRVAGEVHYAAGGSGAGGIEPLVVTGMVDERAGLVISSASESRLKQDMQTAAEFVRASNPLAESIASQGVLLPTTLVPVQFAFADGSPTRTVLCTVDGSSRLTAAMDLWGLTPEEVLFELSDGTRLRSRTDAVRNLLNVDVMKLTSSDKARLRTRILPAQLIVGWEPEEDGLTFPDILDAYLGLLHVEPPTPWGEAAGQDSRAEAVLDELTRMGRLTDARRKYLAGHLSPTDAVAAGFDASLDGRSAAVFYELDRRRNTNAVNRALRRIGMKGPQRSDRLEVATELAMRPYRRLVPDLNRRNPRQALPAAMESLRPDQSNWSPTTLEPNELLEAAVGEPVSGGSAARAELAVRGAFWLTRFSSLQKSSRTDPRLANEVLKEMQAKEHGLRCLYQAIVDGRAGIVPRQVREDGSVVTTGTGADLQQTDRWLRETFPKAEDNGESDEDGPADPQTDEVSAVDVLRERIYSVRDEASTLARRVEGLAEVEEDGQPLVERVGIASDIVSEIASDLDQARTRVVILGSVWQRTSDVSAG